MLRLTTFCVSALVLSGCSTVSDVMESTVDDTARVTSTVATEVHGAVVREDAPDTIDGVGRADTLHDALLMPARDVNIRREAIPVELARLEDPYADPGEGCEGVASELAQLNGVLGPDYDADMTPPPGKTKRRGFNLLGKAAGSVIPFRGLVREVTGAKKHERELREAFRRGKVRRGYLKGVAVERECELAG